jgi:threonine aldolase
MGGKLANPTETNMVWLDLQDVRPGFVEIAKEHGLRVLDRGRLVVHYQISDEAVSRLEQVMKVLLDRKGQNGHANKKLKVGERAYG